MVLPSQTSGEHIPQHSFNPRFASMGVNHMATLYYEYYMLSMSSAYASRAKLVNQDLHTPMQIPTPTQAQTLPDSRAQSLPSQTYPAFQQPLEPAITTNVAKTPSLTPKPQCWDHECNGRRFSSVSNLLRHCREKDGIAIKVTCPYCQTRFTRSTAMNSHLNRGKCKGVLSKSREKDLSEQRPSHTDRVNNSAEGYNYKAGMLT